MVNYTKENIGWLIAIIAVVGGATVLVTTGIYDDLTSDDSIEITSATISTLDDVSILDISIKNNGNGIIANLTSTVRIDQDGVEDTFTVSFDNTSLEKNQQTSLSEDILFSDDTDARLDIGEPVYVSVEGATSNGHPVRAKVMVTPT